MAQLTVDDITRDALDLGLLDERQLQEVWSSFGTRNISLNDFLLALVRREYLTNYQVEQLRKGKRTGFYFGDYKALYLVGSGTFARVYRAVHRKTGQVAALKVLRNRYSDDPVRSSQFLLEGRVGCSLRHPNIVPVYEVISQGKYHIIVMEFVEGRNLREFVRVRKKLDPAEATQLMIGITDGMRYAFEHGLTHRDLRMSNVLISSRGEAKLADFGLAAIDESLIDDAQADVQNTRTVDYVALERASGVPRDDTRSDIYFLGCMYYHMLCGKPALVETRDRTLRLSKQRFVDVVPVQKVDPSLPSTVTLIVNKAMMLDPSRRYQSPSAMLADLRLAAKQLVAAGDQGDSAAGDRPSGAAGATEPRQPAPPNQSVMVVEADVEMQNVFREGLKRAGFRVLMTGDPGRAVARLQQEVASIDCVLVNAQILGEPAVQMFNQLTEDERTAQIPAVLLLDEHQHAWQPQAITSAHRAVLRLPVTMKQLLAFVNKLLRSATSE